jgi:hypothetical protein
MVLEVLKHQSKTGDNGKDKEDKDGDIEVYGKSALH